MTNSRLNSILGGKWSVSWVVMFYTFPILLFAVPFNEDGFASWWIFWRWTIVSFLSLIPFYIVYLIADLTVFKKREIEPVPSYYVVVLGLVLGLVRGGSNAAISLLLNMAKHDELTALQFIIFESVHYGVIMMLALPFWTIIAATVELYSDDRKALIADLMLNQSSRAESAAVIKSLRSSMTRKVDENLLEVIEDAHIYLDSKGKTLEENWELMAVRLRKAALDTIRPFSHALHRAGEEKEYRVKLLELLRFIVSNFRIEPLWVVLGYIAIFLPRVILNSPFIEGFINISLRALIIYIGLKLLIYLRGKGYLRSFFAFTVSLMVFSIAFSFFREFVNPILDFKPEDPFTRLTVVLILVSLTFAVGLASTIIHGQHAEAEFLERQLSKEQLQAMLLKREEERLSRELAKYLHGTIQSRLMASAMAIERAGRKGDKTALKRELAQAYASLKVPSASYFAAPAESFRDEIMQAVEKWKNLMEIKVSIDKGIKDFDSSKAQEVGNAINEGLSNAFRHGSASNVKLSIKKTGKSILVQIVDDGEGPKKGKGGLGTEWFNAIAGKSWSLKPNVKGKGSTLELHIPVSN
jgi:signal transduction histidine kinase